MNHKLCEFLEQAGFLRCFRDPIRVPRTRENLVPRIREIGSLQVHTGTPNIFLKKICNKCIILWKYEQTAHLIQIASCFRAFPMFWNVASARDEIPLRKWSGGSAHLRSFRRSIGCKECVLLAAMLFHSRFFTHSMNQVQANLFNRRVICRKPKAPASRKTSL